MLTRRSLVVTLACFAIGFTGIVFAADKGATGTWKWSSPARAGQPAREYVLTLKQDGDKLTGTLKRDKDSWDIQDGAIKDNQITFKVVRKDRGGKDMTVSYDGKLDGDTITGKSTMTPAGGQPNSRDWKATRAAE